MYSKKKKSIIGSLLVVIAGILIITSMEEIQAMSVTNRDTYTQDPIWLDATDSEIFGENALDKKSSLDQSKKLQAIIDQSITLTNQIYIPAGIYILNENVTLRSGLKLRGDLKAPTIFKNTTNSNVTLSDENYQTSHNIEITQFFFEGISIFTRRASNIVISDSIFYHPIAKYAISLNASDGATVKNNIFMRDHKHATPDTENRAIYIGGFATSNLYEYMENVQIIDNLFGLRINELDAIKSFSNESIISTVDRLQFAIRSQNILLKYNEQNYFSCGINSYNNIRNVLIKDNLFQQMYENENRHGVIGDHAIYLRGSQNVQIVGNHLRGLHNGPYGGFKFKSGRDITIMNNYLRNTGLVLYETPECGLGDSFAQGKVAELSNILVANNIFDFKEWQDRFAIGVEYNRHTGVDNVFNGVFLDNHFVNYHNIPSNRRRELLIMNGAREGFKANSSFVSGNTRDDTEDRILDVEYWTYEDQQHMPQTWMDLIDSTVYEKYKDTLVPVSNTLPVGREVVLVLGKSYDVFDFVSQTHDDDEEKPEITLINPEVLKKIGHHQLELLLSYKNNREVRIFSNVTIITQSIDEVESNTPSKSIETQGQITFSPNLEEAIVIPPETSPDVIIPPDVSGVTGPLSIVKSISMDFGLQVISTKDQIYEMNAEMAKLTNGSGKTPYVSFVQIQDFRGTNEGWTLNLSLSNFTSTIGNSLLKGVEINLIESRVYYAGHNEVNAPSSNEHLIQLIPNTGTVPLMIAPSGFGAGTSSLVLGNQADLENQMNGQTSRIVKNPNILLSVPGRSEKEAATYTSTLTWELANTPDNLGNVNSA